MPDVVDFSIDEIPDINVEWIWNEMIARRNLTLLSGAPKAGKSTLLFDFLKAMKTEQPFLGLSTTCVQTVLVTEESSPLLKMRRDSLGLGGLPLRVLPIQPSLTWPVLIATLKRHCVNGAKLLIVDTLSRFWDTADENDATQVLRSLNPLFALTRAYDVGILLLHHTRKQGGPAGRAVRGSNALIGAADISVELDLIHPYDKTTRRRVEVLGRYGINTLFAQRNGSGYELADEQTAPLEREVLRFLEGEPGATAEDVAESTYVGLRHAQGVLTDLTARGILERTGSGAGRSPFRYAMANKEGE